MFEPSFVLYSWHADFTIELFKYTHHSLLSQCTLCTSQKSKDAKRFTDSHHSGEMLISEGKDGGGEGVLK